MNKFLIGKEDFSYNPNSSQEKRKVSIEESSKSKSPTLLDLKNGMSGDELSDDAGNVSDNDAEDEDFNDYSHESKL